MPRIGIDARSLNEKTIGAGRYLSNLLKYFPDIDKENYYYLFFRNKTGTTTSPNYIIREAGLPGFLPGTAWINLRLSIELIKDRIDLLHCPFYNYPFIRPCPAVVTIHDLVFEAHPGFFPYHKTVVLQAMFRHAAGTARRIIAISDFTKNEILKYYKVDENNVVVIHEAAEDIFRPVKDKISADAIKTKYNIRGRFLLHVGAIHERRNIFRLLEAFRIVAGKQKDVMLLLIGRQIFREIDLPGTIKGMGIENKVALVDETSDHDLLHLYNAAEALVYPSLYEGFGLPMVEAMSCGTPVIASNISVMPEVLGGAGAFFDPYNIHDMADKISAVLNDEKLRSELGKKGIERAAMFSWRRAAERTLKVYQEALEVNKR